LVIGEWLSVGDFVRDIPILLSGGNKWIAVTWGADMQAVIALLVLGIGFIFFVLEKYPPAVVAICMMTVYLALGFVSLGDVQEVFSNSAPMTIAMMFVISGVLVATGCIDSLVNLLLTFSKDMPKFVMFSAFTFTIFASAFINNTPVILMMIPVFLKLSETMGFHSSRVLMPLSFATMLGGTCTLLGTSGNILINGLAEDVGIQTFSLFEVTPIGLTIVAVGSISLFFLGKWLLPYRSSVYDDQSELEQREFVSEVFVLDNFPDLGKKYGDVWNISKKSVQVLMIVRDGHTRRYNLEQQEIRSGDRFMVRAPAEEIANLNHAQGLHVGVGRTQKASDVTVSTLMILPNRMGLDSSIEELSLADRHRIKVLAVRRVRALLTMDLYSTRLRASDVLLIEGTPANIRSMMQESDFLDMGSVQVRGFRKKKAPIVLWVLAAMLLMSIVTPIPVVELVMVAVGLFLGLRCIDMNEALRSIDGSILLLVCAMMVVSKGLENTGAMGEISMLLKHITVGYSPFALLCVIYFATTIFTEIISSSAVAVVFGSLSIDLAVDQGLDPRVYLVAVMIASSASFATPIGYQNNTIVYGTGNYRFSDFLKVGIPMNIIVGVTAVFAIEYFMM